MKFINIYLNYYFNRKNITQYDNAKIHSLNFVEKKHLTFKKKILVYLRKVVILQL